MIVDLPSAQILTGLQLTDASGTQNFLLGANQFTYSIPGVGADFSGYPSNEPNEPGFGVLTSDQADDFRTALMLWDELIPNDFTEVIESGSTFGEVRVAFTTIADPGTAAFAYSGTPQAPGSRVGDVWVDSDDAGADFSPGTANFETFLHEIGHVGGEKHPFDSPFLDTDGIDPDYNNNRYTVMSYNSDQAFVATFTDTGGGGIGFSATTEGTAVATTPMVLDVFFVQAIYGVETTTRVGNTTYSPIETDLSMSTIFDSGGTDTLDLSAFTRKNIVDLRPGAYSSIGLFLEADQREFWKDMFAEQFKKDFVDQTYDSNAGVFYEHVDNLGIAFSTTIENAFGGSNADDILGNDVGNDLRGNGGDDTLQGGKGDDTINGGADSDIAVFSGNRSVYSAQVEGAGFRLTDQRGGGDDEGSDVVEDVETFRFADGDVAAANLVGANQAPTANDDTFAAAGTTPVNFDPKGNDTDPESDTLTITGLGATANGTPELQGNNTVTYTANGGFSGEDTFTYTISDNNGGFDTGTVTVNVSATNDPPTANDDTPSTNEDTAVVVSVLANDTDPDLDPLTVTGAGNAVNGTLSAIGPNTVTFTPTADFTGTGSFTYTIEDGNGGTDTGTVTVTVNPVNDPPVANDDGVAGLEDQAITTDFAALTGNDTDIDGGALTVINVAGATNGSADIVGTTVVFTPNADFNGTASYDYTVSDGAGGSDTAQVTVTVTAVNDDPVAVDDSATLDEDSSATISVLANDSDIDGGALTVTGKTDPANGDVTINGNGTLTYVPDANFNGTESFEYTISDGAGGTSSATVTVTVDAVNDEPVANDDAVSGLENQPITTDFATLTGNDTDIDGGALTITAVANASNGSATIVGNNVVFTPTADFSGTASYEYTVSDGNGGTDSATVTINVNPVNDPPVAAGDTVSAIADQPTSYDAATLLANDSDVEGDTLTVTSVGGGVNGSASLSGTTVTFNPDAGFTGPASFTYTISDSAGGSDTATVSITVNPVNDDPVAGDDSAIVDEDGIVTVDVLANDSDIDGGGLTVTGTSTPANGTANIVAGGITYTPNGNFNGADSFTYTISDGAGGSDTATVSVTVNPVNDAPIAADDGDSVDEDGSTTISVLANDSDVDGDTLTVTGVSDPANGEVTINGNGTVTYQPAPDFNGSNSFTYSISESLIEK